MTNLRNWSTGHWVRRAAVATTIVLLIAITVAGWAYLASLALEDVQTSALDEALAALNEGRYEEARALVTDMLQGSLPKHEYGGPLYVLGAVKIHDAEQHATSEERQTEFLVASRYLREARVYGFPPPLEIEGLLLLGQSLLESNQYEEGIQVLEELLVAYPPAEHSGVWEAHRALAEACLLMPEPNLTKSLTHNDAYLTSPTLAANERADALLVRAQCLSRLGRLAEARQALSSIPTDSDRRGAVLLANAQLTFDELIAGVEKTPPGERPAVLAAAGTKVADAMQQLQQAKSLDTGDGPVARGACYQLGRGFELQGNKEEAIKQYLKTRQIYGDTPEGLAAALAEAELLRQKGDLEGASLGYRRVLESINNTASYRGTVLPLETIRTKVLAAFADFAAQRHFEEALALLDHFTPLFPRSDQLEFRGELLRQWGELLLSQSTGDEEHPDVARTGGMRQLRAAGLAFEQLAELRFASRSYSDDVWRSAESYFRGHCFSRSVRQLNKYLNNDPERRAADALLRLGQAHLALGQVTESVAAFQECIEFHPKDSSTYQARIDCAKAYLHLGSAKEAEQLLRENLDGSTLKPNSREWKDSLFELGMLLHQKGEHEQAITTLEEAVERYPQDSQSLLAQYMIGESYHQWAEELLTQAREAPANSETEKMQQLAMQRLNKALEQFETVQRSITLKTHDIHSDPVMGSMLRNCYMLEGTVLFDMKQYDEAIKAYSNVSSLYPNEPFVLETFVQIANCWRRLKREDKARGAIQQAQINLERLPTDADFAATTSFNREEWRTLLADISAWGK